VISAYYYLRVVVAMYMRSAADVPARVRVGALAAIALVVAVVGILSMGLFPAEWIELAGGVARLP